MPLSETVKACPCTCCCVAADRLRQLVALGHTDELQAELEKCKQQPDTLRSHLDKVMYCAQNQTLPVTL